MPQLPSTTDPLDAIASPDPPSTTAPIFDDAVYLCEALNLPVNRNEDDLDAELALLARESGIQDPFRFLCPVPDISRDMSRALSTLTVDSDPRSSMSIHSHDTQSTSFTSAASRTSRDHIYSSDRAPAKRLPPKFMRASVSVDNHHRAMNTTPPVPLQRHSISTISVAQSELSTNSLPTSLRKKRASGIFSMFRKDSSICTSRSHHGHSRSRGLKVECGHALSPYAIRVHIQEALQSGVQSTPQCCGIELPRSVLESVLTKEETDLVLNGLSHNVVVPECDSMFGDDATSPFQVSQVPPSTTPQASTLFPPRTPVRQARYEAINVDLALANEAFKSFKCQQKEQFERIAAFEWNQRKALSAHHQSLLEQLRVQHTASKEEQTGHHELDLEHLEESQILAEHDLRKTHAQEVLNVAIALKHMEAYCLATNVNHPEHAHTVTEEDFKKLDRQRHLQANLPRKHENAINVLRARQEREIKRRLRNQEDELSTMDNDHSKNRTKLETEHTKELERLEVIIEARRRRVMQRWELKFEIWRRDWEDQHATTLTTTLEHEEWPLKKVETNATISEASMLAQYVKVGA